MVKWHSASEPPIAAPMYEGERCSRPILILRNDGVQFVGIYTYNKKGKRKSPCWEILKRSCTRTIVPANQIAAWAELPNYPMGIKPIEYDYWHNPFLVTDDVTEHPAINWFSVKEFKPETQVRPYCYSFSETVYYNIKTSCPVLFCTSDGQMFVGVLWQNIGRTPIKEEYDILVVMDSDNDRDFLCGSAINKTTIKAWAYLPEAPKDILMSLSPKNHFSASKCIYESY